MSTTAPAAKPAKYDATSFTGVTLSAVSAAVVGLLCQWLELSGDLTTLVSGVAVALPSAVAGARQKGGPGVSPALLVVVLGGTFLIFDSLFGFALGAASYAVGGAGLLVVLVELALLTFAVSRLVPRLGTHPYRIAGLAIVVAAVVRTYIVIVPMRDEAAEALGVDEANATFLALAVLIGHTLFFGLAMAGVWWGRRRVRTGSARTTPAAQPAPAATPVATLGGPPADWYLDAEDTTALRYWDGTRWTLSRVESPDGAAVPPPSWCPDPEEAELLRWWDGSQWTDHRRRVTGTAAAAADH